MYRASFILFKNLYAFVIATVVASLAMKFLGQTFSRIPVTGIFVAITWALLAYTACAKALQPNTQMKFGDKQEIGMFVYHAFVLFSLISLPYIALFIIGYLTQSTEVELRQLLMWLSTFPVVMPVAFILIVLPLLGTVLPAAILQKNEGYRFAFALGSRSFWAIASRMLIGPLAIYAMSLGLAYLAFNSIFFGPFTSSQPAQLVPYLILGVIYLIKTLSIVMASWILCDAYISSENITETTNEHPSPG
ncbi:MAG: hypothetical protein COA52_10055 [Hyphomicrobiales bacterium]|nr:hypothetical protein [Hyphomicrobiales bacterium]PCJ90514.1 MAG: hypothetical protein COA52_10055 [Hyphomicrobiales bacterium]